MSTSTPAVFLSYASQDAEAARRIRDALQAMDIEVWFDQSELRGGDMWDASIRKKIKECALFVAIISANTQARDEGYFRLEWKLAVDRSHLMADDKAFLLPVVVDGTLDVNARVPEKFRDVQWTHLPGGTTPNAFAELVQRLLRAGIVPPSPQDYAARAKTRAPIAGAQEPTSIAVLPFVDMSRDGANEYFADGLAEELLNVLAKIRGLRVAARTSSFQFKGQNEDIAVIGRKLNVATVLEGSVRQAGKRMRIFVRLVKVADGYNLWSGSYDRTLEDIFAVQDDIAQSVVTELRATLLAETLDANAVTELTAQIAAAVKGRATDAEAHRLYLQARHFIGRHTRDDTMRGIEYLKRALDRDPEFALAWVELSGAYTNEVGQGWAGPSDGLEWARDAAARALELEPELAQAHAQMGWIQMTYDWDWRGAEASYAKALAFAPVDPFVLRRAGWLAANFGRVEEAIRLYRRAIEQDALSAATYHGLGMALDAVDRLAEGEEAYRKVLELSPHRTAAHAILALNLLAQGRLEEALSEALREPEGWARRWGLAIVHHAAGRLAEADVALRELIAKDAEGAAYNIAQVYAARGEIGSAFEWFEHAYVQRDAGLSEMKAHPLLRPLHHDPRWAGFLRKMRLAD